MKKMYWRPQRVSRTVLALISIASVGGFVAVENFKRKVRQPYYQEKIHAARIAQQAFKTLQNKRVELKIPIDKSVDPAQTGLIGEQMTPVTTNPGVLSAKQTSLNPNFAAVIVDYLRRAGVSPGDVVAVGYSGSFPGINTNVLAALQAMKMKPVIISSAASSQWGANIPEFMWLDMEKTLVDAGVVGFRSVAASVGGIEDRGLGIAKKGKTMLEEAITKAGVQFINPKDFDDSVAQRLQIYREQAGDLPIKAYINVGGGTTSVGTHIGKRLFRPGLNRSLPKGIEAEDSIMAHFVQEGVPVVHLTKIEQLAAHYGFPNSPAITPAIGDGTVYFKDQYNLWLAGGLLLGILVSLYTFVRSDLGFRIMTTAPTAESPGRPEPMV
jgi:poly-gamma-glutamate system protein